MARIFRPLGYCVLVAIIAVSFVGCGRGKSRANPVGAKLTTTEKNETEFSRSERHLKIRAALAKSDFSGAEKQSLKAVEKRPDDAEARFLLAKSLVGQNHFISAVEHLEKALAIQPDNTAYKRLLCEVLDQQAQEFMKSEKTDKAITAWKRCMDLKYKPRQTGDNLVEAYKKLSDQMSGKKKFDEAESALREAVSLLPDNTQPSLSLAQFLISTDRLLEAQIVLKGLVEANPKFEEGAIAYANLLRRMGDSRGAMAQIGKVLKIAPGNADALVLQKELANEVPATPRETATPTPSGEEPEKALLERLADLEASGDFEGQAQILDMVLKENPDATWAQMRLASLFERQGNASEALSMIQNYLERKPDDFRALLLKARCQQMNGNLEGALSTLSALPPDGDTNVQVNNEIGQIYAKMGKFEDAQANWKKVLEVDPEYPSTLFNIGQLAMEQAKYSEAKNLFDRALRKEPNNLKFIYFSGINLKQSGKPDEARKAWEEAKAFISGQDPYGQRILRALGEKIPAFPKHSPGAPPGEGPSPTIPEQSIPDIKVTPPSGQMAGPTSLSISVSDDPIYKSALEDARAGKYQEAIDGFNAVLKKNPRNFNALMNLGNAYTACERFGDAAAAYLRGLRIDKNNGYALKALSKTYDELGLMANAAGINARLGQGGTSNLSTKSNPRSFEPVVRAFLNQGLAEEALPIINSGIEENPEMTDLLILQGEVLHKLGKKDLAETALNKAIEMDKQNPVAYLKLGDMFADNQRMDLAFNEYQSALKAKFIDPDIMFTIYDRFRTLGKTVEANEVLSKLKGMNLSDKQMEKLTERQGSL